MGVSLLLFLIIKDNKVVHLDKIVPAIEGYIQINKLTTTFVSTFATYTFNSLRNKQFHTRRVT